MDWSHQVVLITGASSGIGRALAVELARRGAKLGLLARPAAAQRAATADSGVPHYPTAAVGGRRSTDRPVPVQPSPGLIEVLQEIEQKTNSQSTAASERALLLPADVRDARAVRAAANRLREEFGKIDVLIANAGVGATTKATELDPEAVAQLININVIGAVNSVAAVLPEMVERRAGQLVALSSLSAYRGLPKSAAYCASKASVSAFFESVRVDLIGSGVDVTIIHPGFIKTPLTAGRKAKMPYLMELDDAVKKIVHAIEKRKKSYSFPWQLATLVRACMLLPIPIYDWIAARNSFRE
jgi:NAD(P)-dependent dehydrogenase (short-subunit alcohol dehydrogenase family)